MGHYNTETYKTITSEIKELLKKKKFPPNDEIYNKLVDLEEIWRETLISSKEGADIYQQFIDFIVLEQKDIRCARPYFRVRQKDYVPTINKYIKQNSPKKLSKHRINHHFIQWVMAKYNGPNKKFLETTADQISGLRSDFVTRNFPLILNRVKILWHHMPNSELSELLAAATQAALIAVDKFAPSLDESGNVIYTSVILSSILARINAVFTSEMKKNQMHFFPKDKKMLINVMRLRKDGQSDYDIAKTLNISEGEVYALCTGLFTESIELNKKVTQIYVESSYTSEDMLAEKQSDMVLRNITQKLPLIQQKILILKRMKDM